jgi:hypothetical protein
MSNRSTYAAQSLLIIATLLFAPATRLFAQGNASTVDPPQQGQPAPPITTQSGAPVGTTSQGWATEPGIVRSAIDLTGKYGDDIKAPKNGFYPEISNMITGAGWLSVGPGYRHYFKNDQVVFDTSAAVSWHLYKMAQARVEMPKLANEHLKVGGQWMWDDNTSVNYFGIGDDVSEDARSQYREQNHDIVGYATYTTGKPWLSFSERFGYIGEPVIMAQGGTFKRNFPNTIAVFPNDPAVTLADQPALLHSYASVDADTRDHRGHPTEGGLLRAALTNYWDRSTGFYTFHTWEAEALHYFPVADKKVVFALHGWTLYSDPTQNIPFYLIPAIGGSRTLRDYHDFQFRDNNLLVVNAESRFAVWQHLDTALFVDAGNVAPHWTGLSLGKTSYGAGLRLHNDSTTLVRLDVAHGGQGWHAIFSTSEPFRLPRASLKHPTAIVPFYP